MKSTGTISPAAEEAIKLGHRNAFVENFESNEFSGYYFELACEYGQLEMAGFILSFTECHETISPMRAFLRACEKENLFTAKWVYNLIKKNDDIYMGLFEHKKLEIQDPAFLKWVLSKITQTCSSKIYLWQQLSIACKNNREENAKILCSEIGRIVSWYTGNDNDKILDLISDSLIFVCDNNNLELLKFMLNLFFVTEEHLNICFSRACENGNLELAIFLQGYRTKTNNGVDKLLREYTININNGANGDPLVSIKNLCEKGRLNIIQWLNDVKLFDVYGEKDEMFYHACAHGQLEIAKYLFRSDFICSAEQLKVVCKNDRSLNCIVWLHSICPFTVDMSNIALCIASEHGAVKIVKFMIFIGANVNAYMCRPLRDAFRLGHDEIINTLCESGADVQKTIEVGFMVDIYGKNIKTEHDYKNWMHVCHVMFGGTLHENTMEELQAYMKKR